MSAKALDRDRANSREPEKQAVLTVLAVTSDVICALPASCVARLAEVAESPVRSPVRRAHPALLGTVELRGEAFVAWDLARLLALPPDDGTAWVALSVQTAQGPLRLALRLARCLSVLPVRLAVALPPALFRRRCGAIGGTFLVPRPHAEFSPLGLLLDPARLLSEDELLLGAAALRELDA